MVRILTDSSCDLSAEEIATLGIHVVPLNVTFSDGEVVRDGIDLTLDTFYERLKTCEKLPKTSQPSPDAFMSAFEAADAQGDEVVGIFVSAQLSGTFQCAKLAADLCEFEALHLVDSETVCLALGLLVRLAAKLRDEGKSAAEIASALEIAKKHVHIFAVIDNLDNLRKGGRLPAAAAIAGGLFGIKPLITVADGAVSLCGKARGLPGAYVALFKKMDAVGGLNPDYDYYAGYTASAHEADPIKRYFAVNLQLPALRLGRVGCAMGTHAGLGAFGIAFFDMDMPTAF